MLKWLMCKIVGIPCAWKKVHEREHRRPAYGMYVNVAPDMVSELIVVQTCEKCGKYRSCSVTK
jgi:hypothetical protein